MTAKNQQRRSVRRAGIDYIGIGVGAIVLNEKGEIGLLRRIRRAGKGLWGLPGGRVQVGETLEAAIMREITEELGVRGHIHRHLGFAEDIGIEGHWISALFVVSDLVGTPFNREPRFHSDLRWFGIDRVPQDLMLVARIAINRIRE